METTEPYRAVFEFETREWDYGDQTLREEITGVSLLGGDDLVRGVERITKGTRLRVSGVIKHVRLQRNVVNGKIKEMTIELEKPMAHSGYLRVWMERQKADE